MEELIDFLNTHPYIDKVYFLDGKWHLHIPQGNYVIKSRESILNPEVKKDVIKKEKIKKTK